MLMILIIVFILGSMVVGAIIEGSSGGYGGNSDCLYCGGGDTDGNHCYTCDDDF